MNHLFSLIMFLFSFPNMSFKKQADTVETLTCNDWYPPYQETAHTAICYNTANGLTWAASTQMIIALLAMVIISLRIGFYELNEVLVEEKEDDDETNASNGCRCCCKSNNQKKKNGS